MKILQVKVAALAACVVLGSTAHPGLAAPLPLAETSTHATGTQTIVLQHTVPIQIIKFLHWDQAAKLPAGVTKVEAVPAQNALAVTALPAGLIKVREILKVLDIEPRQVLIQTAYADVSEADLEASGIKFEWVPQDQPGAGAVPVFVRYASGEPAARLLQTLTKQPAVLQPSKITTTNNNLALAEFSTTPPSGQTKSTGLSVTPRLNSDSSTTLALRLTLAEGSVKREISTLRTIGNRDTIVIVLPPAVSSENSKNILLFVTPTLK